jgi:chitinase
VTTCCQNLALAIVCMLPVCTVSGQKARASRSTDPPGRVIGYFAEHGVKSGRYTLKNVATSGAAAFLTELNYAFGKVANDRCEIADEELALSHPYAAAESVDGGADSDGPHQLRGTFHQLQELKRLYPHLKIVISFGGWGQSDGFSSAVQPEHLRDFVRSCVHIFIEGYFAPGVHVPGVFDGIDIDWEYPVDGGTSKGRPEDIQNFTAMAAEFRRQLAAVRPGLLLTAALPAEAELYANFELKAISQSMDFLSIMAYDLHWNTEPRTYFHSALFRDPDDPSTAPADTRYGDFAVQGFVHAGVPRKKIVFGVPFYGKGWTGVKGVEHGLYQPATGPAKSGGGYSELQGLPATADRQYNSTAVSCTVWNDETFWSYDCPEAIRAKAQYVRAQHLGGAMFWELSHDTPDLELLRALTARR